MNKHRSSYRWIDLVPQGLRPKVGSTRGGGSFLRGVAASLLAFVLVGCGGGSGGGGSAGASAGPAVVDRGGAAALAASTALTINITGASVNSPPVVNFTVTNETGAGMNGIVATDLRFNIAKLSPGVNGEPTVWQNYINIAAAGGAVQGSQEAADLVFGTLVNHGDGTYTYTFATNITNPAANPCPAPCKDAAGKALDLSFQPNTTHRVAIQQGNPAYPVATGVFDFVPGGGVGVRRDIVATAKCNECHEQIAGHEGTRVDTRLCVTCHNPGSSVATPGQPNVTVDFKVMIHKIHYNNAGSKVPSVVVGITPLVAALPSVIAGTPYVVGDTNFSARRPAGVTFTQDARNCTKCHDGTAGAANATTQGDNWKNAPNMDACSSCHDDVFFGTNPDPAKPYQTVAHPGGVMTDNSTCALCHGAGRFTDAKDIVVAHGFPTRLAAATAKFKYNIISVTVNASRQPVINFSVTDPTNANAPYDIKTAAAFSFTTPVPVPDPVTFSIASTLTAKFGWSTSEFINDGRAFGQAVSINLLDNAAVVAGATPGTFTVTSTVAIPATQTGTLRALMEGHPAVDVDATGTLPPPDKLRVKSVFKDFVISGTVTARRLVVDVAKCDVCHGVLSWHDNGRNDEPGICVVCHNPNATDSSQRPGVAGVDGKLEESTDFKTMIHAIHAGQADKGGFRTQGITVYGSDGPNDFTSVIFPGKLNDCAMCHIGTSYQLTGPFWDAPTAKGILGTTISSGESSTDPADNLRITPIAAVCSSCHDSAVAKLHMQDAFNAGLFGVTQTVINAATPEACSFCHGPGRVEDVQVVHGVK